MGLKGKIKKGLVFVVSAPAGTGKTTLVEMLTNKYPDQIVRSISCTTRSPRGEEKPGVDYLFLSESEFNQKIDEGAFLEHAQVFDHQYGTLKESVERLQREGKHVALVIDTQGGESIKNQIDSILIFIRPPSLDTLRERLQNRHTDSPESIDLRLSWAEKEMKKGEKYDVQIVNDDLQKAFNELESFIHEKELELCSYQ